MKFSILFSAASGLLAATFLLEAMGALLIAVNWGLHHQGVQTTAPDFLTAIAIIFAMAISPFFSSLPFLKRVSLGAGILFGVLAIALRGTLLGLPLLIEELPWTAEILSTKRTDLLVGIVATIFCLGLSLASKARPYSGRTPQ